MLALGDGFVLLPGALTEGLSGVAGSSLVFFCLALGETIDFHLYCTLPFQKLCLTSGHARRCFPGGGQRPLPHGRPLLGHLPQPLAMSLGSEQSDIFIPSFVCQGRTPALYCGPFEREFIPLRGHNLIGSHCPRRQQQGWPAPHGTSASQGSPVGRALGCLSPVL